MNAPWSINIPKETHCPYCNTETIELYDENANPMNYKKLLEIYSNNKQAITYLFDRTPLDHFMCHKCKQKFIIDWTFGYPVPFIGGRQ